MIKKIYIKEPGVVLKVAVRNSKWLRTRSGVVKQRNTRIRRDWFRMKRTYMSDSFIVTLLMDKYNVSRRTVYNAVNRYV